MRFRSLGWSCVLGIAATACQELPRAQAPPKGVGSAPEAAADNASEAAADNAYEAAAATRLPEVAPENHPDLHNVYHLSKRIISGGEPHGEAALERIAGMGVKTILSVDGKVPDQETAAKYGLRYVHVPIQYRAITDDELVRICKTFRELEGPFFVHCFHGKHRGPAAAAIGRLVLDRAPRERALAEMRQWCGTSGKYEGLYRVVASRRMPTAKQTKGYRWSFPAAHVLKGFREVMIRTSRAYDHLKHLSGREWKPDPAHPDVDPVNEADKLAGLFAKSGDLSRVKGKPEDFRRWITDSAAASRKLHASLVRVKRGDETARPQADSAFKKVQKLCNACHAEYRNE